MRVISVNVARPVSLELADGPVLTAIFKSSVSGPVFIGRRNLEGDRQADLRVHGGPDKAVYAYPSEHYPYWADETGRDDFEFGQFGENLTTEGLLETSVCIGDQFKFGTALLEISQPRFPCFKLGIRMGDRGFVKRFFASRRSGFYLRVIEEGAVQSGDSIVRVKSGSETIRGVYGISFDRPIVQEARQRLLDDPKLAGAWKDVLRDFR